MINPRSEIWLRPPSEGKAKQLLVTIRRRGLADDYDTIPSQMVVATPAKWGALPAVVLFMTLPLMFIGTLMSYEVVRGMWGYHQPTRPGNLLVRSLAETIAPVTD